MSRGAQFQLTKTRGIPTPSSYIVALLGELRDWAFDEERAPDFRGRWRAEVFGQDLTAPLDLEIGTGNGFFFAHHAQKHPERCFLGIELKYKPLIQSIRRVLRFGGKNTRIVRYNARMVKDLFAAGELNDVYIHFPDPWARQRQHKHRLIQDEFLAELHGLQRPGAMLDFKTDSRPYFDWAVERFKRSAYQMERLTYDLHKSEWAAEDFTTHFEKIFLREGLPIHYARLKKI